MLDANWDSSWRLRGSGTASDEAGRESEQRAEPVRARLEECHRLSTIRHAQANLRTVINKGLEVRGIARLQRLLEFGPIQLQLWSRGRLRGDGCPILRHLDCILFMFKMGMFADCPGMVPVVGELRGWRGWKLVCGCDPELPTHGILYNKR